MPFFCVTLNMARAGLLSLPEPLRLLEARRQTKLQLLRVVAPGFHSDAEVPDSLIDDEAVRRYLELTPPPAAIIPDFQLIIGEIEASYILGLFFAAGSAACVSIERMLNLARIRLHAHHPKIPALWEKGPLNSWAENIDALHSWAYLDSAFAQELKVIYKNIRNPYLHSGTITDAQGDAKRSVESAYKLIGTFLGFPPDLFRIGPGIECLNPTDPRYIEFYRSSLTSL